MVDRCFGIWLFDNDSLFWIGITDSDSTLLWLLPKWVEHIRIIGLTTGWVRNWVAVSLKFPLPLLIIRTRVSGFYSRDAVSSNVTCTALMTFVDENNSTAYVAWSLHPSNRPGCVVPCTSDFWLLLWTRVGHPNTVIYLNDGSIHVNFQSEHSRDEWGTRFSIWAIHSVPNCQYFSLKLACSNMTTVVSRIVRFILSGNGLCWGVGAGADLLLSL